MLFINHYFYFPSYFNLRILTDDWRFEWTTLHCLDHKWLMVSWFSYLCVFYFLYTNSFFFFRVNETMCVCMYIFFFVYLSKLCMSVRKLWGSLETSKMVDLAEILHILFLGWIPGRDFFIFQKFWFLGLGNELMTCFSNFTIGPSNRTWKFYWSWKLSKKVIDFRSTKNVLGVDT